MRISICVLAMTCWIVFYCGTAMAQSYSNVTGLIAHVLSDYTPYVRPILNQSDTLAVKLSINLYNLLDVDTVQGVLTVIIGLRTSWTDERVTWSPADHGGVRQVKIEHQLVWTPPLTLVQPIEFETLGRGWMPVTFRHDGRADWYPGDIHRISCPLNMKYWPFDEQKCAISYFLYGLEQNEASLQGEEFGMENFTENGEWSVLNPQLSVTGAFGRTGVVFRITLRRKYAFYTVTLIIPLVVLSVIGSFVFILPSEAGERVGFCVTILLSMTVFLDIISDDIPRMSPPLPIICQYLIGGVVMHGVVTIIVIINLHLFHRGDDVAVPVYWKRFVRLINWQMGKVSNNQDEETKDTEMKQSRITVRSRSIKPALQNDLLDSNDIKWQHVCKAIDRVCFVLTIVLLTVHTAVTIVILTTGL